MDEQKEIYFYPYEGTCNYSGRVYFGHKDTREAIKNQITPIHTYSMSKFSMDLIKYDGYRIYLVGKNGNITEIREHMPEIAKDLRWQHNILKMFIAGVFDELIN